MASDAPAISEARKQLLEKLRRGEFQVSSSTPEPVISRSPGYEGPLSAGQEQIWFHAQLAGSAPIYNESVTIHKRGPLDSRVLERCFNEIARRHQLWRSAFPMTDGKVVQRVDPNLQVTIPFVDLSHLPAEEREAESARIANEDVRRPFDLSVAPLFRLRLVRWSEDYHRIYLTVHHLVFDGVSIYRVVISELGALYDAYSNGRPSPLPEVPVQYRDFAAWQQERLATRDHAAELNYWRETLSEDLPSFELPTDRPRLAQPSFGGGMETCFIPAPLIQAIKELGRREGVTPYMILLAAFQVLLHRYSGQDEIIVGGATNTRSRPELEPLVGYFLNAVVYRTQVAGDPSFREFLAAVKTTVLGALAHSEIPFDAIVRALAPKRVSNRHPLFQVLFSMRPPFTDFPEGWDVTDMEAHSASTGWDLFVEFSEHPEGLSGRFVYSTDLFDRTTILRLQSHFQLLLERLLANPDCKIGEVSLLAEQEHHMLLVDWNNTAKSFPNLRIHELFEAQVEQNPDRSALVFRGERLTYAELNVRANQLAHHLRQNGAVNGSLIGVCIERSFEMVVALLAILKAGAAYVPYDPELPVSRLKMMLEDSNPVCVITQEKFRENLAGFAGKTLALDSLCKQLDYQPSSNPRIPVEPSDPIYAIYTSGSTGAPKAAINTHEAVTNRILWMQDQYRIMPADRVLQKTPYTFDVSVWEFFWPITCGATLVIAAPGGHRDPAYLTQLIALERITTLHFVPSMLREFLDGTDLGQCASLKRVMCSGEALPPDLRHKFYQRLGAQLHNLYGPTEAAVDVTYFDCSEQAPCATVPIGRPIANVKIYILDHRLAPVPIGVAGELYIGGIAVARGYLNRAQLTAERFIPDPFEKHPGARLYKTGDQARFLPDGNIEYLGRNDNQVKLRGFRVELGEIESAILANDHVRGAAVLLREDPGRDKHLIGYVVRSGSELDAQTLKAFLKERLPEYMVPVHFMFLESLPLFANGKLNRGALPAPQSLENLPGRELIPARDSTEAQLVAIWEKILEQRPIGIRDNFFDLGGHSILLIRLIAQIEKEFGQRLTVATVFASPAVEALAAVLSGRRASSVCHVVALKPEGTQPPFICLGASPLFLPLARLLGPDRPFCGFDLTELRRVRLPNPCRLEDLAAYVVRGIREFQPEGPYSIGGWCLFGVLAYEAARQLIAQGHQVELLTLFDTRNTAYPKGLSPLGRLRMTAQKWQFHLTNLVEANSAGMVRYSAERIRILRGKIRGRRERLAILSRLDSPDAQLIDMDLMDINPIIVHAANEYEPQPYSGRVLMVQSAEVPTGKHWQMAVQWRQCLLEDPIVHLVQGGHETMFKSPYVEALAGKMKPCFEPPAGNGDGEYLEAPAAMVIAGASCR